jgi:hypothetical protein
MGHGRRQILWFGVTAPSHLIYDRHNLLPQEIDEGDVEAGIGKRQRAQARPIPRAPPVTRAVFVVYETFL